MHLLNIVAETFYTKPKRGIIILRQGNLTSQDNTLYKLRSPWVDIHYMKLVSKAFWGVKHIKVKGWSNSFFLAKTKENILTRWRKLRLRIATRPQVATCNKSSISPLQREKPKIYSPFFLFGKPAFCSVVIKRNKPTKERNLERRNILSHRWKSFHARLKRKTTWSRVVAAFYIGFCCAIALIDWKACAYYICHAGIFLHVMNSLIVYLFIFFFTLLAKKVFAQFWQKNVRFYVSF